MFLASFILDLLFGVDRRLRERQAEIEEARQRSAAEARQRLLEELRASEQTKD